MQVFDYIVNAVKRTGPSIEITDDDDMATREDFSSWEWLVLNVCEVRLPLFRSLLCCCISPALTEMLGSMALSGLADVTVYLRNLV